MLKSVSTVFDGLYQVQRTVTKWKRSSLLPCSHCACIRLQRRSWTRTSVGGKHRNILADENSVKDKSRLNITSTSWLREMCDFTATSSGSPADLPCRSSNQGGNHLLFLEAEMMKLWPAFDELGSSLSAFQRITMQ